MHVHSAPLRSAWWLAGGVVAGFTVWVAFDVGGPSVTRAFDDLALTIAPVVTALLCLRTGRRLDGRAATAWRLLGAAFIAWAIGQLAWSAYELLLHEEVPYPSAADVGYLAFYPSAGAAMLLLPVESAATTSRLRAACDGAIVTASVLFTSWAWVLDRVWEGGGDEIQRALTLAYPIGDAVFLSVGFLIILRSRAGLRSSVGLLTAGFAALALADTAFCYLTAVDRYDVGAVLDSAWLVCFVFVALAALTADRERTSASRVIAPERGWLSMLPYAPVLAVAAGESQEHLDPELAVLGAVVFALVVVRQLLIHRENLALTRMLTANVDELAHRATHDPLTGLLNHASLLGLIASAHDRPGALLAIDLDHFKLINDSYGHLAGDEVLRTVARRLRDVARAEDHIGRWGGDEFVVVCADASTASAERVAQRILDGLQEPVWLRDGTRLHVNASVGIARWEPGPGSAALADADAALFSAKAAGRNRYVVATDAMSAQVRGRARLHEDLRAAVAGGEITVHYQPVVEASTGATVAVEALLRWDRPEHPLLGAGEVVALAEESGLIGALGEHVLRTAVSQTAAWRAAGHDIALSVNVSPSQLDDAFVLTVLDALRSAALPNGTLWLEVTESTYMDDRPERRRALRALRDAGVRVALDDFGTGYSSLAQLKHIDVDVLKVDGSFVRDIAVDPIDQRIVSAITTMAAATGIRVVAECVETDAQREQLVRAGAEFLQGRLFAPPLPADDLSDVLAHGAVVRPRRPHLAIA